MDTATADLPPDIVVSTASLRFGLLAPGVEEVKRFTVRNDGGAPLDVTSVAVTGVGFSLVSEPLFLLDPGDEVYVDVAFSPPLGPSFSGLATINSNDPDEPEAPVELIGEGEIPQLELEGDPAAFADVSVPCTGRATWTLRSVGTQPVTVSELELTGASLTWIDPPELPLVLAPGASAPLTVEYGPALATPMTGGIVAVSDDPDGPDAVTIEAPGGYAEIVEDRFTAPIDAPVDILFGVDCSPSMGPENRLLAQAYEAFITTVEGVTDDWRIGVATAEDGCFSNGVLSAEVEDYTTLFQDAVTTGERNPFSERLLALVDNALNGTGPSECNAGFLREGALLHVIIISDEEDQSPLAWSDFLPRYGSHVADPSLLKVSVIGDLFRACGRGTGAAGYEEMAEATGGLQLDICDVSWVDQVDELALASLTALRSYPLTQVPDPDSIEVLADGVAATGWSWESEANVIVFETPLIEGEDIVVRYGVPQVCD
jgi:hypothetical protein